MARRLSSPVFVGRSLELERLEAAYGLASNGRSAVVVVAGEAGVGKSRLVDEAAHRVRSTGGRVLVGQCVELGDVGRPFAPLIDALRQLATGTAAGEVDRLLGPSRRELARLVPALGVGTPSTPVQVEDASAQQAALFEHLLGALDRLGADRPLLLVFEDLHWADGSTRDLVRYLARTLRSERVAFVLTYRSDDLHRRHPLRPLLADLDRLGAERLTLVPFDALEVGQQIEGILGHVGDPAVIEGIASRSDGNAFFVEELLAAGGGDLGARPPEAIGDVVTTHVARLGADAQDTLRIAAVIGRRVDHGMLARLSPLGDGELLAALREAVDDHLIEAVDEPAGPGYAFRHALVQECLSDQLLPAEKTVLHRRVAELLEADGATGHEAELAHHWYRAHALPEALCAAVRAGAQASTVGAFAEALRYGERALELWTVVPDPDAWAGVDHAELLIRVAHARASTGSMLAAAAMIDQAVTELPAAADRIRAVEALHRAAWYRWDHGEAIAAVDTVRRAIALAGADAPPALRARLLSDLAIVAWWDTRCYVGQLRGARRAMRVADESGERVERARARLALGIAASELGRPGRGIDLLREAVDLLGEGPLDVRLRTGVAITHILNGMGLSRAAADASTIELAITRDAGLMSRYGVQTIANHADALCDLGELDEAERLLATRRDPLDGSRAAIWLDQGTAEISLLRGDVGAAEAALAGRRSAASTMSDTDALWMEYAEAAVARGAGRLLEARALLDRAAARSRYPTHDLVLRYPLERGLRNEADLAVLAAAAGDGPALAEARRRGAGKADALMRLLDAADPHGWEEPIAFFRIACRAERSRLDGIPDPDAWGAMAEAALALGRRPDATYARFREAEAILDAGGERERLSVALDEALALASSMRLVVLGRDIEAVARRARVPLRRPASGGRDRAGLSPRELEVLTAVADGLTNRQIGERLYISEKTASVHVTHILDKLGVGSRTEAALAANRLGLLAVEP